MVDQSEDHISHTLRSIFVRDGASYVISADRKRLYGCKFGVAIE